MKKMNRRTLLRGVGGACLSLPFLEAMGSPVRADEADGLVNGQIRRFIVVFKGNGVHQDSFFPSEGGSFAGTNLEPLAEFQNRALVMDGVKIQSAMDSEGEMHQTGMGSLLSGRRLQNTGLHSGGGGARAGWGDGITVDQVIAQRLRGATRFGSLTLGVRASDAGSEVRTRMVYRGPADPVSPIDNPAMAFDAIFGDLDMADAAAEQEQAQRLRVMDAVRDQFSRVRRRVGRADQQRLDRHATFIDELERRARNVGGVCTAPGRPRSISDRWEDVPEISRAQIDNIVGAFACDLTRVATLQYSSAAYYMRCPWLGDNNTGHSLGHSTAGRAQPAVDPGDPDATEKTGLWNARSRWYMGEMAYLLRQLEATPEGDGTLLDSTAVLFCSENGNPHHYLTRIPFVLFGNAGGAFQSGYRRYAAPLANNDMPNHNRLLVALQQAYGIDSDVFGDPSYCDGGALNDVLA
ncbi:MAG: DUF1552 domain-containing protein [Myxococcota bacterium]